MHYFVTNATFFRYIPCDSTIPTKVDNRMKILVQPKPHSAHREVEVDILWDDISAEDIKFLAQQCIIHHLQARIRAGFYDGEAFPEFITIRAEWEVHRNVVGVKDYVIPESWKSGEDKPQRVKKEKVEKRKPSLEELLSVLSPQEIAALLK